MDTFAASAFLEPGLTRRSDYIKVFLLFFIFAYSSSFLAKSSLPVFLVFFLTKMAHKIFIILIQDFFSSSYADRNNGAVPQFEVIFGILYIVHVYQITLMAADKTFLSDPLLNLTELILCRDLRSIFHMKCHGVSVTVYVHDIICVRITVLPLILMATLRFISVFRILFRSAFSFSSE